MKWFLELEHAAAFIIGFTVVYFTFMLISPLSSSSGRLFFYICVQHEVISSSGRPYSQDSFDTSSSLYNNFHFGNEEEDVALP